MYALSIMSESGESFNRYVSDDDLNSHSDTFRKNHKSPKYLSKDFKKAFAQVLAESQDTPSWVNDLLEADNSNDWFEQHVIEC